jgi:hypothetical protein
VCTLHTIGDYYFDTIRVKDSIKNHITLRGEMKKNIAALLLASQLAACTKPIMQTESADEVSCQLQTTDL